MPLQSPESELTSARKAAARSPAPPRLNAADVEVRRARPLLGTVVEIRAATDMADASASAPARTPTSAEREISRLHAAIDAAFDQVALIHRLMSWHDPDS